MTQRPIFPLTQSFGSGSVGWDISHYFNKINKPHPGMKQLICTKIIYACLLLLAILPLGSAFTLTWKELLRLFIITLGLVYLYVRYFRTPKAQAQGVEGKGNLEPRTLNLEPDKPRTLNLEPTTPRTLNLGTHIQEIYL